MSHVDILVVSVDSTTGWQAAARELAAAFERSGASVALTSTGPVPRVRTFMLTDLVEARAARAAARRGIEEHHPRAIVYCSMTASLLWPRPGAIWLDSIARENRPGRHGIWQRMVERKRLGQAPMLLAMSEPAVELIASHRTKTAVVPTPVERSGPTDTERDLAAVTYVSGDPTKRRLELVLDAWRRARKDGEVLVVAGGRGGENVEGVDALGKVAPEEYRALLRRARVFVAAPRREEYGIAPLEALADGCMLVSTPASGPYPALGIARELDPRLVGDDLASALRAALDTPRPDYAPRAELLLRPFSRQSVDATLSGGVLPKLLGQPRP